MAEIIWRGKEYYVVNSEVYEALLISFLTAVRSK